EVGCVNLAHGPDGDRAAAFVGDPGKGDRAGKVRRYRELAALAEVGEAVGAVEREGRRCGGVAADEGGAAAGRSGEAAGPGQESAADGRVVERQCLAGSHRERAVVERERAGGGGRRG